MNRPILLDTNNVLAAKLQSRDTKIIQEIEIKIIMNNRHICHQKNKLN